MAKKKKGNNNKIIIIALALAAVGYYLYQQTTRIIIGGASPRVHKINLNGVELRIDLTVINESNLNVDVQNFLGRLMYGPAQLGIVSQVRPVRLTPFQTGIIEFQAKIEWVSVALEFQDEVRALINSGTNNIDWSKFRILGTLKAENVSIPINEKLLA
jgi:hypothetical protein